MRRGAFVVATASVTGMLVACSLLTDTSGLTGGGDPTSLADAADATSDGMPIDGAVDGAVIEGGGDAAAASLGPLWLAYGTMGGKIGVRQWVEGTSAWSSELAGPDVGAGPVRWVVPKETPLGSFLAVSSGVPAHLDVFERTADGKWMLGFTVPVPVPTRRGFDIEYESGSHAVLVVYADTTAVPKYRRRTASSWSAEGAGIAVGSLAPNWLDLARNPVNNEIALMNADQGSNLGVSIWNGGSWGSQRALETHLNTKDYKCFDVAFDNVNGSLLAAWGYSEVIDGGVQEEMRFISRPVGGAYTAVMPTNGGLPPGPLVLAPEPGSARIALSYVEYNCNKYDQDCDDFVTAVWSGTSFTSNGSRDGDTTTLYSGRPATMVTGVAWLGTTGVAIAAYHRDLSLATSGQLPFTRFSGSSTWSSITGADTTPPLPARASMQLVTAPGPRVVALVEGTDGTLWSKAYRENAGVGGWSDASGGMALATTLVPSGGVPFGVTSP